MKSVMNLYFHYMAILMYFRLQTYNTLFLKTRIKLERIETTMNFIRKLRDINFIVDTENIY